MRYHKSSIVRHRLLLPTAYCLLPTFYFLLFTVSVSAQFTIIPNIINVTCPGGNDGYASVSVSGGIFPYTFQWFPGGQTTQSVTGLTAGNYSVAINDNAGNDSTISISVSQPPPISDNDTVVLPFCTNNGYIILNPAGGTTPYQFLWNTGHTAAVITGIGAGDYSVVVTDANNCTASFFYSFMEPECFVNPDPYFTPNDDGFNDTWTIAKSQYFPEAKVIVFDRWGTRVYQHEGLYEPWDGKSYLGIPVPDAVYYYFFYEDKDDKQKNAKSGSVTIVK